MKQHRFIRFLGREVEAAGAQIADVSASGARETDPPTGWAATPESVDRVQRELPRRIADRLNGRTRDGVEFVARTITNPPERSGDREPGADLGIVFDVDLPTYAVTNAALVQTMPLRSDPGDAAADRRRVETGANRMLTTTADAFSFVFPVDGGVRVVPAAAIRAYTDAGPSLPETFPDEFYMKSLGRFVEDLARCFVGDHDLVPAVGNAEGWEETRQAYLDTMAELGLSSLLYLRVQRADRDARLDEF